MQWQQKVFLVEGQDYEYDWGTSDQGNADGETNLAFL